VFGLYVAPPPVVVAPARPVVVVQPAAPAVYEVVPVGTAPVVVPAPR
jgi:hypothetical protein